MAQTASQKTASLTSSRSFRTWQQDLGAITTITALAHIIPTTTGHRLLLSHFRRNHVNKLLASGSRLGLTDAGAETRASSHTAAHAASSVQNGKPCEADALNQVDVFISPPRVDSSKGSPFF